MSQLAHTCQCTVKSNSILTSHTQKERQDGTHFAFVRSFRPRLTCALILPVAFPVSNPHVCLIPSTQLASLTIFEATSLSASLASFSGAPLRIPQNGPSLHLASCLLHPPNAPHPHLSLPPPSLPHPSARRPSPQLSKLPSLL